MRKYEAKNNPSDNIQADLDHGAQKIGLIGVFLGSRENAVLYLASAILVLVLCLLGTLMFIDQNLRPDVLKILGAIGVATIGYIGGLVSK